MSLVCFPFKTEHVPTVLRNVHVAAEHPAVSLVLLVGACRNACFNAVVSAIDAVNASPTPFAVPVVVQQQQRVGALRPGKGDGMNSALDYFLRAHSVHANALPAPLQRIHFYDADISSFDATWITKAEAGAALGYDVVRHYFPRSSTDAQVTWQITKVGFAMLWPRTKLPWVQQPLGGELCLSRAAAEALACDARCRRQSDWGVDTVYTFVCAQKGLSLLEVYVPQGKMHGLYGGLGDLKTMVCECFAAMQSLLGEKVHSAAAVHRIDPAGAAPRDIREKVAYDVEKSFGLLRANWSGRQETLLRLFGEDVAAPMLRARDWPEYGFMTERAWVGAYRVCLREFVRGDDDWHEVLFRLWVARVLNYTMRDVIRGYDYAMQANTQMVMKLLVQGDGARAPSGGAVDGKGAAVAAVAAADAAHAGGVAHERGAEAGWREVNVA